MRSLKPGFILVILTFSMIGMAAGQYLYLIENDCTSSIWVDASPSCVFNSTHWQLTGTGSSPIYEDFTAYTESYFAFDDNPRYVFFDDWDISDEGILYKSLTANSSFTAYWKFNLTDIQNNNPGSSTGNRMICFANGVAPDYYGIRYGNYECFGVLWGSDVNQDSDYFVRMWETENGNAWITGVSTDLSVSTDYYMKLEKSGAALNLTVYSDAAYSVYVDHVTHTMQSNNNGLQFFYALLATDYTNARSFDGYLADLTFEDPTGGYDPLGYIYTEDLLVNTTMGPAYVYCSGHEVPAGTGLKVSFSSDNSTWVRENTLSTVAGSLKHSVFLEDLNYTSLYARYELTSDGSDTPKVQSMALAYEIDDPGTGSNGWIYALLAPIAMLLGVAVKSLKPV